MSEVKSRTNKSIALRLLVLVTGMFGFGYALVPLYDVFCDITGLNGKTGVISAAESQRYQGDSDREVTVEFVASINGEAGAWEFQPQVPRMTAKLGTLYKASYVARNLSGESRVAQAVPSVAPGAAARYFQKTQCFCFDRQEFQGREQRDMPLTFVIDPDLPKSVTTVTLSYTFFRADPA